MNLLTEEMRKKFRRFVEGPLISASDDAVTGALLEAFAIGIASGRALPRGAAHRLLVETDQQAMKLTGGTRYFASKAKPTRQPKKRRK